MVQTDNIQDISSDEINSSSRRSSPRSKKSRKHDTEVTTKPKYVKRIVLAMLKQKSFVGKFKERRYVEPLEEYRDLIEIQSNDPIIPYITDLQPRIITALPDCWPGITLPTSMPSLEGYSFWVPLADQTHEQHHFRIMDVIFKDKEVLFVLKMEKKVGEELNDVDFYVYIGKLFKFLQESVEENSIAAWRLLTLENIKSVFVFMFMLITALGTGGVYLGEYFLRLMREVSYLIQSLTPTFIKCLDVLQRIIGACFILVRDILRPPPQYPRQQNQRQSIRYR